MEQNVLEKIEGISSYPIISLIVFFLFFAGIVIWMIRADNKTLEQIGKIPLESDNPSVGKEGNA